MDNKVSKRLKTVLWSVLLWLVVWEAASHIIGHDIILVSPVKVLVQLGDLVLTPKFWLTVATSFLRIISGFFIAVVAGVLLAVASTRYKLLEQLVAPPLMFIKATPVASFIILILIWVRPSELSLVVSFLIVLPIVYSNVYQGISSTSTELLEMAQVFKLPFKRVARYIYLPHIMPFFTAACSVALGLCWKAGIAAEIIGVPKDSIGENLYLAKLYLNTTDIFAWTIVIIVVSVVFERMLIFLLSKLVLRIEQAQPKPVNRGVGQDIGQDVAVQPQTVLATCTQEPIIVSGLCKSFGDQCVFCELSCQIETGSTTCFVAPSGRGKTTLLEILLGLKTCDKGCVKGLDDKRLSAVFQEDRLCENINGLSNCLITAKDNVKPEDANAILTAFGLAEHIHKPVRELSGGMRRRVALARALLAPGDVLVLDEPFKGLDDELKKNIIAHVAKTTKDTTVLLVTHDRREAQALGARIVELN